jgi:hypothetical protein
LSKLRERENLELFFQKRKRNNLRIKIREKGAAGGDIAEIKVEDAFTLRWQMAKSKMRIGSSGLADFGGKGGCSENRVDPVTV